MPFDYDLFVIGAGSGGVRAARLAASTGARVAVAEESRIGGTCVVRGCVPKKLLVYGSHFAEELEDARGYGWTVGGVSFSWDTLRDNTAREVERLSGIYAANLARAGAEVFRSRAVLEDANRVRLVTENRSVTAKTILIATGAAPFVPEFPGREHVITSNEAFLLPTLPESMIIVGGGYIAVEFAGIFNSLGVDVTLVYRGPQILRGFDDDLRNALADAMRARGVRIELNKVGERVEARGEAKVMVFADGTEIAADVIMSATGRRPHSAGLGLAEAGVHLGAHGEVLVDEFSRTSVANIFAVGDVTGRINLTPVAIRDAIRFVDTVFHSAPSAIDHNFVPTAVFSQPEIGTVGMTEAAARARCNAVDIYKTSFRPMKYILAGRDERMLMKLVVDAETDVVVGAHILGPDAAEMAQILAIPMRMHAKKADFDATMALHPSAAEELVTLREKWQPARA